MRSKTSPKYRALILDMDGVLWRDSKALVDLPQLFNEIDRRGIKVILATNNATRSGEQYLEKLRGFGVNLKPEQVINSAQATAQYLNNLHPLGGPVFVIGEQGLLNTLADYGFFHQDEKVVAVVVGMDRNLTYEKLRQATLLVRSGIPLIGTNPDRSFPTPEGLIPGTGSILAALEAASDVAPVVIGKPQPEMYKIALERLGAEPDKTLVVGDRLETDIAGAQALGCHTALVLTGVTTEEDARTWIPELDMIARDVSLVIKEL